MIHRSRQQRVQRLHRPRPGFVGDTPPEREVEVFGDPLDAVWRRCVAAYLGDPPVERLLAGPLAGSTPAQREGWLADVAGAVGRLAGP